VGRILAVDPGARRVGLALTDIGKTIASPFDTIPFVSLSKLAERLSRVCGDNDVELVVIGFPVRENGYEGEGCARSRVLAKRLAALGVECLLWDESWSSRDAEEAIRSAGKSRRRAKETLDAVAASLILRDFLESRPSSPIPRAASSPEAP
jgi:putative Holliday junction resolvase